jgi:hypothetical protein
MNWREFFFGRTETPNLERVADIHLATGDVLVFTTPQPIPEEGIVKLKALLEVRFPGVSILVLTDNFKLSHVLHCAACGRVVR